MVTREMLSDEELNQLAARYVWWLSPQETLRQPPSRLLLQVMRYATFEDARAALEHFGPDTFRKALASAPAGALNPRSWNFWHLYLGLSNRQEDVPPMPLRKVEDTASAEGSILRRESQSPPARVNPRGEVNRPFVAHTVICSAGPPATTEDRAFKDASLLDLLGTKLKVLLERVEAKDYRDIAALLHAGVMLGDGLGAAKALYGTQFPPCEALKALIYFQGGDLNTLERELKDFLTRTVKAFQGPIPIIPKASARSLTA